MTKRCDEHDLTDNQVIGLRPSGNTRIASPIAFDATHCEWRMGVYATATGDPITIAIRLRWSPVLVARVSVSVSASVYVIAFRPFAQLVVADDKWRWRLSPLSHFSTAKNSHYNRKLHFP